MLSPSLILIVSVPSSRRREADELTARVAFIGAPYGTFRDLLHHCFSIYSAPIPSGPIRFT